MNRRYELLQKEIEKQTQKMLQRMQKREEELQKKLQNIDSAKSQKLFAETKAKYLELQQKLTTPTSLNCTFAQKIRSYVPGLDSLQTALAFMKQKGMNISSQKMQQLQALSTEISQLQGKLQIATLAQTYFQQREQLLKQQLSGLGLNNQLMGINKEAYYYQQQLQQYKATIGDKEKIKQAVIVEVMKQPAFQNFWQKNSILASIFPMPDNADGDLGNTALANLQTRTQIGSEIQQKIGSPTQEKSVQQNGNNSAQAYVQKQAQQAQSELDKLKSKISQLGNGGSKSDITIPDFTPNSQKTKTFLKRLELGLSMQNTDGTALLPATTNIAGLFGYKINDKVTAGIGAAYLLGWGAPVKDIHFSSQGIGVRSYLDIKAKGNLWISGGFEYNYMQGFASFQELKNLAWQKSALIGLTKKYKIGSKTGNMQILYDLLYKQEIPRGQPLKFRVGYSF